ncbi:MAG: CCA tRNA nucleotidyltransferase [Novosphingobium sp.]|nr:CCA tRNA nucleotidyltransferase [Novosphingobium sp.]
MAERLPEAEWTRRDDLLALIAALGEGNARYVGGAVRDTVLGVEVHDIDCATPLEPVEVIDRLDTAGIRTVPTGLKHGTITAILDSGNVEITTLREDVETFGRHAEVRFSNDWKRDASRRDFTINALYADPVTLEIFDYFGGLDDLKNRHVRFIGDARQRIQEDHLRILRYFRFQARFGSQPADDESESACSELAATLKGLSRERVGWELQNLLTLLDPSAIVARMQELGVLQVVLPEALPDAGDMLARLAAAEQRDGVEPEAIRRFAAILPAQPATAQAVASRLRLSNRLGKHLVSVARRDMRDAENPFALAYRVGLEAAIDRLLIEGASVAELASWERPVLPLKGGEIVERGVAAGPEVARILQAVENRWIDEGFPERERVERLLEEELAR